jgi:hypothetical protein
MLQAEAAPMLPTTLAPVVAPVVLMHHAAHGNQRETGDAVLKPPRRINLDNCLAMPVNSMPNIVKGPIHTSIRVLLRISRYFR